MNRNNKVVRKCDHSRYQWETVGSEEGYEGTGVRERIGCCVRHCGDKMQWRIGAECVYGDKKHAIVTP